MIREEIISKAVEVLKSGGIILYPSDTIWGIGCDATNKKAINKVLAIKQRVERKNLIILVSSFEDVANYVKSVPDVVSDLIGSFNRPLTVVYPDAINLPDNLIADDGSIGIRVARNELCELIINKLGNPIVSTSANISGSLAPLTFSMISKYIKNNVDHIINIRQEGVTEMKPSTIIRVGSNNEFTIIRE